MICTGIIEQSPAITELIEFLENHDETRKSSCLCNQPSMWLCSLYVRMYAWLVSSSVFSLSLKYQRTKIVRYTYIQNSLRILFQRVVYLQILARRIFLITAFDTLA